MNAPLANHLSEDELYGTALDLFNPQVELGAFDWCEKHLYVRDGKWTKRRAGLLKHWYDIATARITGVEKPGDPYAHLCEQIYLVTITQIAKTTFDLSLIAWLVATANVEMGLYMSRNEDYRRIKARSLRPMIENSPILNDLLPKSEEARERALSATDITVGAAMLHLLNGNLIEDLRGLPLEVIFADEIEQLRAEFDDQGSPIELMIGRQRTKPYSKLFVGTSSPAALHGHAWTGLCGGSHERLMVVCEECQCCDYLNMSNMVLKSGIEDGKTLRDFPPEIIIKEQLTRWHCSSGCMHDAHAVQRMLQNAIQCSRWIAGDWQINDHNPGGIWTPQSEFDTSGRLMKITPPENRKRTGWANALYSTFTTLDTVAASKVEQFYHGTLKQKKVFVNTEECGPWFNIFVPTTTDELKNACLDYQYGMCPVEPDFIILSFDQQGNQRDKFWYPYVVRAYKRRGEYGAESWLIAAGKAMNSVERDNVEEKLWPCGKTQRTADIISMDVANGNYTSFGYIWASEDPTMRVCLRGADNMETDETWRETPQPDPRKKRKTSRPYGVHEWRIHAHHWRTVLQDRLLSKEHEPPFHIPSADTIPDFYLRSMTAEEMLMQKRRSKNGGYEERMVWELRVTGQGEAEANYRKDNHWADAEKMNLALAEILGINTPTSNSVNGSTRRAAASDDQSGDDDQTDYSSSYSEGVW